MVKRSGSFLYLCRDLVFANGGPDLKRVFVAGLFTLLEVDLGALAAPLTLDLAALGTAGLDLDFI